jgi:hypothetical protein
MPDEQPPVTPAASGTAPAVPAPQASAAVIPAATAAVPTAPAATTPAAPADAATANQPEPTWLKSRLDQAKRTERTALLAELGVTDPEAAKKAIAAAAAAAEAEKTTATKLAEREAALTTTSARLTTLEQTVKARADTELAGLTDAQRAAVAAVAGDDPARVLTTIDALKPTWASAPAAALPPAAPAVPPTAVPPVAPPVPPVATPPATTAPPPVAPPAAPTSPPNHKAEYEALKKTNPVGAAAYLNRYENEIYPRA